MVLSLSTRQFVAADDRSSETNYSPQFQVANTFTPSSRPGPAGTKPSTKPTHGAAPPGAAPPGAAPPGTAPPGTVPPGTAPPGAAPPGTAPTGAFPGAPPPEVAVRAVVFPKAVADDILPSAVLDTYYPPAGYNNGSRTTCASGPDASESSTSAAFPCASSVKPSLGHFQSITGGVGKMDVAIGAAVVAMTFAVVLVL